eukprot:Skav209383  [mRNA]  locus=scaffold3334:18288:18563:- [translate_table: standard]
MVGKSMPFFAQLTVERASTFSIEHLGEARVGWLQAWVHPTAVLQLPTARLSGTMGCKVVTVISPSSAGEDDADETTVPMNMSIKDGYQRHK